MVAFALFARPSYSRWAKQVALNRLQSGALSDARRYLLRAARCSPKDGNIDMMLAFCFRQLRQPGPWQDALKAAERKGVAGADIGRETQLYRIQTGDWLEGTESQLGTLAGQGVTAYDVPAAFVTGCLANGRNGLAQQILDVWSADSPDDPHVAYMRGKSCETLGDARQARAQYETAVSLEPRHQQARVSLAKLFEENNQLQQAFRQYAALAARSPHCQVAALGAARILRKMGHQNRAHAVLEPFALTPELPNKVAEEMGCIAMEQGDLPNAERWFERADMKQTRDPRFLMSALQLMGMQGKAPEAERLYQRLAALGDRVTRARDLRTKLTLDPGDTATAAEIKRLYDGLDAQLTSLESPPIEPSSNEADSSRGRRLFALHCAACHGHDGAGNGRAARHLFPPPRDLRWEPSRLVSTQNGVPALDDTVTMLQRGIPGTSMASYDDMEGDELLLLAEEVHRLRREGLPELFVKALELQGEEVTEDDMEEVLEAVAILTAPGAPIVVPAIESATPTSLLRGKETYRQLGCTTCHGEDGAGAPDQFCHDERGFPVRPRDLTREPFKGGRDTTSVYLRIAAGMPGSPHPACTDVPQQSMIDLVQYCLSLSREPKKVLTDHERAAWATSQAYLASLAVETTDSSSTQQAQ